MMHWPETEHPDVWKRWAREHPEALPALRRLAELEAGLRERLPAPEVMVLYALEQAGHADFTEEEARRLARHRAEVAELVQRYPALQKVVEDIQAAAADFTSTWYGTTAAAPVRRRKAYRMVWRVAAVVVLLLFAGLLWQRSGREQRIIVAHRLETVALPDGSTITLAPGSRLTYRPEHPYRVTVEGRALFDILPRQDPPFQVHTPTALVQVLGTLFEVEANDARTEVVLARGRVAVLSPHAPSRVVTLEPGQRTEVLRGQPPTPPAPARVAEELAWSGRFVFHRTPLTEVLSLLETHYGVRLSVDPQLEEARITGVFSRDQDLKEILQALSITLHARVEPLPEGGYRLVRES